MFPAIFVLAVATNGWSDSIFLEPRRQRVLSIRNSRTNRCTMMNKLFSALICGVLLAAGPSRAAVVISEFLAQNDGGLRDLDGDTPDWIELHNTGASAVDLAGWHLTDNATNLTKWTFPATNIASGGYL